MLTQRSFLLWHHAPYCCAPYYCAAILRSLLLLYFTLALLSYGSTLLWLYFATALLYYGALSPKSTHRSSAADLPAAMDMTSAIMPGQSEGEDEGEGEG